MKQIVNLEYHPQDSRFDFAKTDVCQTLAQNMGMGGNNVPLILEVYDGQRRHDYKPFGIVCETIQARYGTGGNNVPLIVKAYDDNGNGKKIL